MGPGLAGRGAASGPAIVAGKRSGRAITQAKGQAKGQRHAKHLWGPRKASGRQPLQGGDTCAVYTQKLTLGAFETPEWVTFGLHRRLGAELTSKKHQIPP